MTSQTTVLSITASNRSFVLPNRLWEHSVQDSMTFRALDSQTNCQLCSVNLAVLQFDILSDQEKSRQQGACCTTCAFNILASLAGVKKQPPE